MSRRAYARALARAVRRTWCASRAHRAIIGACNTLGIVLVSAAVCVAVLAMIARLFV